MKFPEDRHTRESAKDSEEGERRIVRGVRPITGDRFAPGDSEEVGTQIPGEAAISLRPSVVTLSATVEAVEPGGRIILRENAGQRSLRLLQRLISEDSVLVTLHPEAPEIGSTTNEIQAAIDLVADAAHLEVPRKDVAPYQRLILLAQSIGACRRRMGAEPNTGLALYKEGFEHGRRTEQERRGER